MTRDLKLVALSLFTWGVGEGMFLSFQPLYLQQMGADPVRIGAILGGYGAVMALVHAPAGYLADRFGRRPIMAAAWVTGLLATLGMALATSLPLFVPSMLLYGMTSFVVSPLNSYVTSARGSWPVSRAIMVVSAAFNLGMVFGPTLGGVMGERAGIRSIFLVAAAIFFVSTILIFMIRPQPVEVHPAKEKRTGFLLNNRFLAFLAVVFLVVFATYLPQPLSQNFLRYERGLPLTTIGLLVSLTSLGVVIITLSLSRVKPSSGFLLAQVSVGLFALLLWQGSSLIWYTAGYFLLGGYKAARSLAVAQAQSMVSSASMGLAYGVIETAASIATILAPILAGYLFARNPVSIYSFSFVLIILAIIASAQLSPHPRHSQAPVEAQPVLVVEEEKC